MDELKLGKNPFSETLPPDHPYTTLVPRTLTIPLSGQDRDHVIDRMRLG